MTLLERLGLDDVQLSPWALSVIEQLIAGLDLPLTTSLRECFYGLVRIKVNGKEIA